MDKECQLTLVTGATGFLGKVIVDRMKKSGCQVICLGKSHKNDIVHDLRFPCSSLPDVDRVVHVAGKAHTFPTSKSEVLDYYRVNYLGVVNLCKGLAKCQSLPRELVLVSSVSVYGVLAGENIDEGREPLAIDAYGRSKLLAERFLMRWCQQNDVRYVILRLPLVVYQNPPGNLSKMIYAIGRGRYVRIKNNNARKSVVLASDVAELLAKKGLRKSGIYNLTDGYHPKVSELEDAILHATRGKVLLQLPDFTKKAIKFLGKGVALLKVPPPGVLYSLIKITNTLTFSDLKARNEIGWSSTKVTEWIRSNL